MDVEGINYVVDTYAWVEYLRGTKGQADDFKTIAMKFKAKVITGEDHFKKIAYPDKFGISSTIGNLKEFVVYIGE